MKTMPKHSQWLRPLVLASSLLLLCGCVSTSPVSGDDELFVALGGEPDLRLLVDEFIAVSAPDPRVAPTFANTEMKRFREKFYEHLCELSGGPCVYSGDPMVEVHRGLKINEGQFNAVVENLQIAMSRRGYPQPVQNRLLARLAPFQRDIVVQPGNSD